VSRSLGLSRTAIALIELGRRRVTGLELERMAALYGRSPDTLLSPTTTGDEALDRLLAIAPDLSRAANALNELKRLLRVSREIGSLETALAVGRSSATAPSYDFPLPATEWEAIQQSLRTAEEERRRLDLGVAPIRDSAQIISFLRVRAARVDFPEDVSGLFLSDPSGYLVAVRRTMPILQRRFMYVHGFAHVLFDRGEHCQVCRAEHRGSLREVRANAFAAAFLMPEAGVRGFLASLGKGMPSRETLQIFDVFAEAGEQSHSGGPIRVERRGEARSQRLNLYEISHLAFHFGVSRSLAIHRLRNLRLVAPAEADRLLAAVEAGERTDAEAALSFDTENAGAERDLLRDRVSILGLEALRRGVITRDRLEGAARLVGVDADQVKRLVQELDSQEATPVRSRGARSPMKASRRRTKRAAE
jgi:Zn-dependent peptidase ImmA (M78 family)/transcriptional regulator with XRE-family HTH domain